MCTGRAGKTSCAGAVPIAAMAAAKSVAIGANSLIHRVIACLL
jgi:hypothetical protein